MRLVLALAVLLPACTADVVPVHLTQGDSMEDRELVEEAAAILGLGVRFVDWDYGAIQLELRDECQEDPEMVRRGVHGVMRCGRASGMRWARCHDVKAWSVRDPLAIAHETAHLLGLTGHSADEANLMHSWNSEDAELTDEQLDTIAERAGLLGACR